MKTIVKFFAVLMVFVGSFAFGQNVREPNNGEIILMNPTISTTNRVVINIKLIIGRNSRGCFGFGICSGSTFSVEVVDRGEGNAQIVENNPSLSGARSATEMLVLQVGNSLPSEIDSKLYVDQDIKLNINGKERIVPQGIYDLKEGSSLYGNYFIALK